jgi:hypothetical protein
MPDPTGYGEMLPYSTGSSEMMPDPTGYVRWNDALADKIRQNVACPTRYYSGTQYCLIRPNTAK